MRIRVGTSGFAYKEWKGAFYPEKLPAAKMLAFYAERFETVEINNTFYRMPKPSALAGWARDVAGAPEFKFVLKAPVYLSFLHETAAMFFDVARTLGRRLGPIYVQLPPTKKKDAELLRKLLELVPRDLRVAIEPGNDTWFDDEIYDLLRARDAALCTIDDTKKEVPLVATASFGYLRLRRTKYTKAALAAWRDRIRAQSWKDAWVFFKHEDRATGPRLAASFRRVLEANA